MEIVVVEAADTSTNGAAVPELVSNDALCSSKSTEEDGTNTEAELTVSICMFLNLETPEMTAPFAHVTKTALGVLAGIPVLANVTSLFVKTHAPAGIVAAFPLNVPSKNTVSGPTTLDAAATRGAHVVKTLGPATPPG